MKELERTSEDIVKPNHVGTAAEKIVTDQCMDVLANHLVTLDLSLYTCYVHMTRGDKIFIITLTIPTLPHLLGAYKCP